tara:strand:+ start:228 stop:458 length:231 start_codon:yes stop_codon:yes gene_type:complete
MKKYMAYSFGTLWTLVLIVALVATVIHQAKFQDSATEVNLNHQIHNLRFDNARLESSLNQQKIKYDNYREWVISWR